MAGLTLAGRLCQQNRPPVVVERSLSDASGYAIGLYPLGSSVLHGLGQYQRFLAEGLVVERYELADRSGRLLQSLDLSRLTGQVGPLVMIDRGSLLGILESASADADLRRGVSVTSLVREGTAVEVCFDDGTTDRFDLVVACDGMSSRTRAMVSDPPEEFDAGWILWTWWADQERFAPEVVREYWGTGGSSGPTRPPDG